MLKWAIIFALVSLIAGLFGFSGISHSAAGVSKVLFFISLVVFLVFMVMGLFAAKKATS